MFKGIGKLGVPRYEGLEALVGVVIAHGAHLLSVLVLFALGITVFPSSNSGFALTAALLHIISPAGLFLSAPFAESPCALMTFSGVLLFAKGLAARGQPTAWQDLLVLLSGVSFGIATTLRSNGIFNGLLLLEEAFRTLFSLRYGFRVSTVRHLIATGLGGMSVGAGFLLPQFIAWREYCYQPNADANLSRPWCQKPLPSIYSFVQEHYWFVFWLRSRVYSNLRRNVGLFRYWTISNIPLFLLAAPMISLMVMSGLWALKHETRETNRSVKLEKEGKDLKDASEQFPIIRNLAVSQLILTLLTLTTAHVQIVTRVSSSYPVSLWYLAALARKGGSPRAVNFIRFMVIYAIVQGGLFASFLPPA